MASTLTPMILFHLASLLTVTALWKLIRLRSFVRLAIDYAVMPPFLSRAAGAIIPFAEILAAFLLLHEGTVRYGAILFIILLACFAYAVSRVIKEKRKLSCGCYGQGMKAEADAFTLGKIGYLSLLTVLIVWSEPVPAKIFPYFTIPAGLFLTVLFLLAQRVWSMHRHAVEHLRENQ